jgi:hypothetical protein
MMSAMVNMTPGEGQGAARLAEGQAVVVGSAGEYMPVHGHIHGLGRLPELVVERVGVQPLRGRGGRYRDANVSQLLGPLHLLDGFVQIKELQAGQREQTVRGLLAVIGHPVVVQGERRFHDVQILDLIKVEDHAGVNDLGGKAVQFLVV